MKLKHYATALAALFITSSANAAIMIVSNVVDGVSETLYRSASGELASSGIATIGYFTDGFVIPVGDKAGLLAAYTSVSTAQIGGVSADLGGSFAGYAQSDPVDIGPVTAPPLLGRPIFSLMGDAATLQDSTNFILIQVASFLTDAAAVNTYTSNPGSALPVAGYGIVGADFIGNAAGQGSSTFATLQFVPEPSAALLGALGALGLLRRRRN